MGKLEKLVIAIIGLIVAAIGALIAFEHFIENGVTPDIAAGYAIAIFALVLGAFGVIAVKVNL